MLKSLLFQGVNGAPLVDALGVVRLFAQLFPLEGYS